MSAKIRIGYRKKIDEDFRLACKKCFVAWYAHSETLGGPMLNRFKCISILLALGTLVFNVPTLRADVTGSVLGVVHDSSGAVVSGAKIVATNVQTNLNQETVSGGDGAFRILALPAGTYKLTVTAAGFRTFTETGVEVKVNDQLHYDVTLNVGSVSDQVEIVANAVQVQTENTQLGDVIDSKKMLALPLNGRSFVDLLGLQAGVAPGTAQSIQQDRPVSGTLNPGNISVNGQRETANAYLVNGGDVSEGRNLGAGLVPNLDSIEEFRLITNSFDAEYGKFSGAVVNAITKSGTNGFHGDAFEFLRNDKLDATNYFAPSKSELRRNQFGYAAGGPVWKNKIFWFSDYQGTRQVQGAESGLVTVPTADQRLGNFDPANLAPERATDRTLSGPRQQLFLGSWRVLSRAGSVAQRRTGVVPVAHAYASGVFSGAYPGGLVARRRCSFFRSLSREIPELFITAGETHHNTRKIRGARGFHTRRRTGRGITISSLE